MKVILKLFGELKDIVRSEKVEVNLPEGASVENLLENLSKNFGADFENYLIDEKTKKLREYLQIIVDGKYTSLLERKKAMLRDGSVVVILPPIGGG